MINLSNKILHIGQIDLKILILMYNREQRSLLQFSSWFENLNYLLINNKQSNSLMQVLQCTFYWFFWVKWWITYNFPTNIYKNILADMCFDKPKLPWIHLLLLFTTISRMLFICTSVNWNLPNMYLPYPTNENYMIILLAAPYNYIISESKDLQ